MNRAGVLAKVAEEKKRSVPKSMVAGAALGTTAGGLAGVGSKLFSDLRLLWGVHREFKSPPVPLKEGVETTLELLRNMNPGNKLRARGLKGAAIGAGAGTAAGLLSAYLRNRKHNGG